MVIVFVSKEVYVKWNGATRKYYEERGYNWTRLNDLFKCKIEDLQTTSTVKVLVECDYCGNIHEKQYRNMFKNKEYVDKDCCSKRSCMVKKSEEVSIIKYGVKNYAQTEESKQNLREIFQTPIDRILDTANSKGLEILNIEDYENDRTRLFVICRNHSDVGIQETNFSNIRSNKHCCIHIRPEITSKVKKLNGEVVFQEFIKHNLIPLFSPLDYEGNTQPLPYKCPKHLEDGIQYRTYGNLEYCDGCEKCSRERTKEALKLNEDDVFSYFNDRNLIVIDGQQYENKESYIYYKCKTHQDVIQKITFYGLKNTKVPCEYCRIENSLTSLNRRLRSSLGKWRKSSEEFSNQKCVITGAENYDIHHLYSFNSIIKDALKILCIPIKDKYEPYEFKDIKEKVIRLHEEYIGVCVRKDLHIIFHQIYGKHNNSPEQFEEFKTNYLNNKLEVI